MANLGRHRRTHWVLFGPRVFFCELSNSLNSRPKRVNARASLGHPRSEAAHLFLPGQRFISAPDGSRAAGTVPLPFGRAGHRRPRPAWPGCGLRVHFGPPARKTLPPSPAPPSRRRRTGTACLPRTSGDALYGFVEVPTRRDMRSPRNNIGYGRMGSICAADFTSPQSRLSLSVGLLSALLNPASPSPRSGWPVRRRLHPGQRPAPAQV